MLCLHNIISRLYLHVAIIWNWLLRMQCTPLQTLPNIYFVDVLSIRTFRRYKNLNNWMYPEEHIKWLRIYVFFFVLLAWAALRNKSQCLLFQCMFVQQEKAIDNILGRFLPIPKLRRVCAWIPWIRFIFNDSHKSSGKGNPCKMMSSSIHTIQFFKMKMSSLEMPFRKCDGE